MRIAVVVPGGVSRDGEYRVIPAILWFIARLARDHDVQIVVPWQEEAPDMWPLRGAMVHNLGGHRRTWVARAVGTLKRLHGASPFDVFHAFWARGPGEAAVLAARACRRPVVVHVAGGELVWLPDVPFGNRWPWRRALSRWVLRSAHRVTAASEPMLRLVRAQARADAVRVPLGVDTSFWSPDRARMLPPPGSARIVSVGSLTEVKDHDTLLRGVAELAKRGRDVHADLVGSDTSGGSVPRLVRELGLSERVHLHGYLTQTAVREVVRRASLLVVTSRHEAGPVAMLEAAALGVPTIGTPVGHVAEWAPAAAILIPFGDPSALADAVAGTLDDEDGRLRIARAARQRTVDENADFTAVRFQQIYREVVAEYGR